MIETLVEPGSLDGRAVGESWALVIGGVTRAGNRRARRAVSQALHRGLDVVWLDGFEERFPDSSQRVPLDRSGDEAALIILGYEAAESKTLSGRLRSSDRWRANPILRRIWRPLLRRVGTVMRPRAGWKAVRGDIEALSGRPAPVAIVYADDYAITIAWHAGHIWSSAPILSSFPENT
ncbi:MAG TPA: hypothetical protein VJ948_03060 [Acidimicrobiia bacterium]|nr:hypothetical protein [Acidimicrobiia bacterium]